MQKIQLQQAFHRSCPRICIVSSVALSLWFEAQQCMSIRSSYPSTTHLTSRALPIQRFFSFLVFNNMLFPCVFDSCIFLSSRQASPSALAGRLPLVYDSRWVLPRLVRSTHFTSDRMTRVQKQTETETHADTWDTYR